MMKVNEYILTTTITIGKDTVVRYVVIKIIMSFNLLILLFYNCLLFDEYLKIPRLE